MCVMLRTMAADLHAEKRAAARAAAKLVTPDAIVGLGTGSTVAQLLPALAESVPGLRCVATSVATEEVAHDLGLAVEAFDAIAELDIAIDGADQIAGDGWIVKGGGGAHFREKVVAVAARRFVVIAASDKPVEVIRPPVPLELSPFGLPATLRELGDTTLRDAPPSPDGNRIADYRGDVSELGALAARLDAVPGVLAHGLFPPALTSDVLVARGAEVEHTRR